MCNCDVYLKRIEKFNYDNIPTGTFSAEHRDRERLKGNRQKGKRKQEDLLAEVRQNVGRRTPSRLPATILPRFNTAILISRPSLSNQNVNGHVGVAEAEDTSLSLGRLWIILYRIVYVHRSATFYTLVPCFHAFNPSAAKGEVTRLSYRVELKGTGNL